MTGKEFAQIRKRLGKTQKEMAHMLGMSIKTIHSYEQGWRRVPYHVERQMLYLLSLWNRLPINPLKCWEIVSCNEIQRATCPVWELRAGVMCWFISGRMCRGKPCKTWREKMEICKDCQVFKGLMAGASMDTSSHEGDRPYQS